MTDAEERQALELAVDECQTRRGVTNCASCSYWEFCDTGKRLRFLRKYGETKSVEPADTTISDRLPAWMLGVPAEANEQAHTNKLDGTVRKPGD